MFSSTRPRELLNEMRWREDADLSFARVTYVHRGAPGNRRTVRGDEVVELERGFMVLEGDRRVPYHRVTLIEYGDDVVFEKT